ncbi:MAG: sporulation transcriptional regulator SpoIIID [Anaerostipes hadrus]
MKKYMEERVIGSATYIIEHNATVRQTAKQFGVSKSTVHKDVTGTIRDDQQNTCRDKQGEVLDINKSERHIRGGMATKKKISS